MRPDPGNSRLIGTRVLNYARVVEVFYPGGMRQERHRHDRAALSFVASGRYEECLGRRADKRIPSTLVIHPADEKHSVVFDSDVRIVGIEFFEQKSEDGFAKSLASSSSHRSELLAWLGSRLGREMYRSDTASTISIDGILSEMLAEGSRARVLDGEKGSSPWLRRAVDFVHGSFTTTFSLDDAARSAGVHSAHLSRVFRQRMGCTVGEYVRKLRFEFACQQILSSDQPLCDIALDAGFSDQSHFNRTFRSRLGITPYSYRKLHQQ